eukprot:gene46411-62074_t
MESRAGKLRCPNAAAEGRSGELSRTHAVDRVGSRRSGGTFQSRSAAPQALWACVGLPRLKSARHLASLLCLQLHESGEEFTASSHDGVSEREPTLARGVIYRHGAGMRTQLLGALVVSALVFGSAQAASKPGATLPGLQRDGSVLLPNQWSLRPVGKQVPMGDFPLNVALHPDGKFAAVLHSGYGQHEVRILEVKTGRPVSQVAIEESFYGLAWAPDGKSLFVSGGGAEVIHAFDFKAGYLVTPRQLALRPATEQGVPSGLAVSADGRALYVAESWGQRVEKIS